MTDLPTAHSVTHIHHADDRVILDDNARLLRRKVLTAISGQRFRVDLEPTTSSGMGNAFRLDDSRFVGAIPAAEDLLEIRGDLTRLAWHIGSRHAPAQIEADRLLIQRDHVLRDMMKKLGGACAR